jgi:cystathionine gamma-synthase
MIPPDTPHTVVFSLPEWKDVVELGNYSKILVDELETSYPRHIVHIFVKQVRYIPYYLFG